MPPKIKKVKPNRRHYFEINKDDLSPIKEIGDGGFGTVFHMIWKKDGKADLDVAAKRLYKVDEHELDMLSMLDHPNIVKLIGVVPERVHFMLILELCEGGSLRNYLSNHRDDLPFELQRSWAEQAARAIEYLQHKGVIHKDIKSDNYLIANGNVLKLTDFGLARLGDKTTNHATERGTAAYMAPEVFTEGILSPKLDIFAYGVVLWEIVTKQIPFAGQPRGNILYQVCQYQKRLPIPEDCPGEFASLMRQCWLEDRFKRPTITNILEVLKRRSIHKCLNKESTQKNREWILQSELGKFGAAQGIAICPNGDIAATDYGGARLKVYCRKGKLIHQVKFSDGHQSTSPFAVAVSADGTYFVTDQTNCVTTIHASTYTKDKFSVTLPEDKSSTNSAKKIMLAGLTLDNNGNLLIGCPMNKDGYILTYTQDGVRLSSVKVALRPQYLSVTRLNTIVVSSSDPQTIQVVDRGGKMLFRLNAPETVSHWWPRGVCCTEGTIIVSNNGTTISDKGIYCYSISGQYLDCITKEVSHPMGLAVTDDNKTLMVAERDGGVKVFNCKIIGVNLLFGNSKEQVEIATTETVTTVDINTEVTRNIPNILAPSAPLVESTDGVGEACLDYNGSSVNVSSLSSQIQVAHQVDILSSSPPGSPLCLDVNDEGENGSRNSLTSGSSKSPWERNTSTNLDDLQWLDYL
ncbi:uncharacterized protein [Amphiura filiformis]|uniref:uncharacterized protein n=1 Tax=Amphiura filiformis TaxID=82378 RepID=UPI003B227DA8